MYARRGEGRAVAHVVSVDVVVGRDLVRTLQRAGFPEGAWAAAQGLRESVYVLELAPVSYTHLTLPTICSV